MPTKQRRSTSHVDVEYHVTDPHGKDFVFDNFGAMAGAILSDSLSGMDGKYQADVVVWSEAGARFYGGDDAVEQYREDPDASVFERFEVEIKTNNLGRVP